jgi:hypothetical protein
VKVVQLGIVMDLLGGTLCDTDQIISPSLPETEFPHNIKEIRRFLEVLINCY